MLVEIVKPLEINKLELHVIYQMTGIKTTGRIKLQVKI